MIDEAYIAWAEMADLSATDHRRLLEMMLERTTSPQDARRILWRSRSVLDVLSSRPWPVDLLDRALTHRAGPVRLTALGLALGEPELHDAALASLASLGTPRLNEALRRPGLVLDAAVLELAEGRGSSSRLALMSVPTRITELPESWLEWLSRSIERGAGSTLAITSSRPHVEALIERAGLDLLERLSTSTWFDLDLLGRVLTSLEPEHPDLEAARRVLARLLAAGRLVDPAGHLEERVPANADRVRDALRTPLAPEHPGQHRSLEVARSSALTVLEAGLADHLAAERRAREQVERFASGELVREDFTVIGLVGLDDPRVRTALTHPDLPVAQALRFLEGLSGPGPSLLSRRGPQPTGPRPGSLEHRTLHAELVEAMLTDRGRAYLEALATSLWAGRAGGAECRPAQRVLDRLPSPSVRVVVGADLRRKPVATVKALGGTWEARGADLIGLVEARSALEPALRPALARFLARSSLAPHELEALEALVGEFQGTLDELVALSRAI